MVIIRFYILALLIKDGVLIITNIIAIGYILAIQLMVAWHFLWARKTAFE
jgi:hypothetical protein